jgi:hypothetical protein
LTAKGERTPAHLALAKRCAANAPEEFIAYSIWHRSNAGLPAVSRDLHAGARNWHKPTSRSTWCWHHIGLAHHELGEFQAALNCYTLAGPAAEQSAAITRMASGDLSWPA